MAGQRWSLGACVVAACVIGAAAFAGPMGACIRPALSLSPSLRASDSQRGPRASRGLVLGGVRMVDQAQIDALAKKVQEAAGGVAAKAPTMLSKALKKPTGAPTVCVEFCRKNETPHHKVDEVSLHVRRSKAALIVVDVSGADDGEKDVEAFVKEQATAKGNFPGPTGVVWRGGVDSIEAVAKAAAYGCAGVAFSVADVGDKTGELIRACYTLGMEPLVEIQDKEEVKLAVAEGAKILQVRFGSSVVQSFMAFAAVSLKNEIPKNVISIASVAGRQGGSELTFANHLLNAKYDSIMFTRMMEDCSKAETERYVRYILQEVLSKKSSKIKINENKGGVGEISAPQGWGDSSTHV